MNKQGNKWTYFIIGSIGVISSVVGTLTMMFEFILKNGNPSWFIIFPAIGGACATYCSFIISIK